ncbi:hypothetical protein ABJV78_001171 [Escherichia albertii]
MKIDNSLTPHDLLPAIERMWEVSARKIIAIDATADRTKGAPVHTIAGRYQPKGGRTGRRVLSTAARYCSLTLQASARFWKRR